MKRKKKNINYDNSTTFSLYSYCNTTALLFYTNWLFYWGVLCCCSLGNKEEDEESSMNDIVATVFKFCFQLALLIWTGFELNTNCAKNNLDDENIYILLHYWFYFGCVSIIITVLLVSLRGCIKIF